MKKMMKRIVLSLLIALGLIAASFTMVGRDKCFRAKADEKSPVIKLHYHRSDEAYDGWDVWLWEYGKDGAGYAFADEDGEKVATMEVTPGCTMVGFIVRTSSWDKDINADQFIDISDVISGTVHIYVESKVEGYTEKYGDDCVRGLKLKSAVYDKEKGAINVTMTGQIEGDYSNAFTLKSKNGEIEITKVAENGYNYLLSLGEELTSTASYTITFDGGDYPVLIPNFYSTDKFEVAYTYTGKDLGATWSAAKTEFRVWAPTASELYVKLYKSGTEGTDDLIESIPMTEDVNGTWVAEKAGDLNGVYYTYEVSIGDKTSETIDPYARTSGVNGKRGMILNLESTNPEGWDNDKNPHAGENITDAIIYEGHIRDLTAHASANVTNKGTFLGLTEKGTKTDGGVATGLDHLAELGITHLHILPMYDFGSVDETKGGYNWGYDPVNYNIPEGSYSTDPYNGATRVKELKQMVKTLHENDISVVMDVVYNHVQNAQTFCFNVLVPEYFSRVSLDGSYSSGSGCGNDTATERSMVRKYIVDSVVYWADEYHIDGFRFDLVGLMDVDTINEIVSEVHAIRPDVIFYGEGWDMTTSVTKDNVDLAIQANSVKTPGFAYFNDTFRDALKGSVFSTTDTGFVTGKAGLGTTIAKCFTAGVSWCKSPSQTINYASCHDNNTLFDRIYLSRRIADKLDRIAMNNLAASIYLTSEGVPFIMSGEEMLRQKKNPDGTLNENSYNSGDFVNAMNYSFLESDEYSAVFEYYKGLIAFRKEHPALRLATADEVASYVTKLDGFDSKSCGIVIDGTNVPGETAANIALYFNANEEPIRVTLPEGLWTARIDKNSSTEIFYGQLSGEIEIAPISALILTQSSDQAKVDAGKSFPGTDTTSDTDIYVEPATGRGTSLSLRDIIVIICAAVVAICAVIAVVVLIKRKK